MPASTTLGRSLRFAARHTCNPPKHGLRWSRRQLSQLRPLPLVPLVAADAADQPLAPTCPPLVRTFLAANDGAKHRAYRHFWSTDRRDLTSPIRYYESSAAIPRVTDRTWLRDACTCEECVDPSSGQKRFASTDVPTKLKITTFNVTAEGNLQVCFHNDFLTGRPHVSVYPPTFWRQHLQRETTTPGPKLWDRKVISEVSPYFSYESFMADGLEYRQAMTALSEYGLIFLRHVPESEEIIKDIALKLGVIQHTFYGTTWDVRSKPDAENVAYTNSYLGLHQDLLYMRHAPRIQILHCLQNTCEGGESLFSDGFRASHEFRCKFPELVQPLRERRVTYHYNKGGNNYRWSREVLQNGPGVFWSPPFQKPEQPDSLTERGVRIFLQWHEAACQLKPLFESENNVYEYKMLPGECVIFDNCRVLHGRRAFNTSSGERLLKGTYVENDSYASTLKSLNLVPKSESTLGD
ncbi:Clavaminate synthase-like protein [Ustulina deusta]|nr:Clavaminate synthase-like protein [Ustulina deusta]